MSTDVVGVAAVDTLLALLVDALPDGAALHAPRFEGREWDYVKDCLDTGWVSSVGGYVDRFEDMLRERVGCAAAIATVNGTTALHVLMASLGLQRGDEVMMPSLTFVATANAVAHAGGVPHLVDIERRTLGLDPARLEVRLADVGEMRNGVVFNRQTGARIRAIIAVHAFGHPCDLPAIAAIAARYGLPLIEDAAESLGSTQNGRPTGAQGFAGIFSFNGNKTVTTGGGAVITDDAEFAGRVRHLATTAKKPHRWAYDHDAVGFNYRMPNINAALGCAQLEQLDGFIAHKRALAAWYRARIADICGAEFIDEPDGCVSNFWLNAVLLPDRQSRHELLAAANDRGIALRPAWVPMHRLPMYAEGPQDALPVTEDICDRLVNLPSGVEAARIILEGRSV